MREDGRPRVSIGMPVYNGEKLVARALDSLLSQDFEDFELIISDNASTDNTGEICREYAEEDRRIRYLREEVNLGSIRNFGKVAMLAECGYFMWAAHDDYWDRTYIGKCFDLLEKNPAAVLAVTEVDFVGEDGKSQPGWEYDNIETLGMDVPRRVHELISRLGWFAVYGLMRTEALRSTHITWPRFGADVLLLLELLLLGDFVKVPEPLFHYRLPRQLKSAREYMLDLTTEDRSVEKPYLGMARDLLGIVESSGIEAADKVEIRRDFARTLSFQNSGWRDMILREQGFPPEARLKGKQVLRLMTEWLSPAGEAERQVPVAAAFFPHNPYPPRTGAHHRCMQVVDGLKELGCEVVLCGSTLLSDTPWETEDLRDLRREGLADVRVHQARKSDIIYRGLLRRFYRVMRRTIPVDSSFYAPPGLKRWFSRAMSDLDPDIVLINYAHWDRLARGAPGEALRVMDYLDILSVNHEMRKKLELNLPRPPMRAADLDDAVIEESFFSGLSYPGTGREFRIFDKYDFTLCINRREAADIGERAPHTRPLYLPLAWEPVELENTYEGPALFLTGPNPFNLQGYFYLVKRVLPLVREKDGSFSLKVTGYCCDLVAPGDGAELAGFVPDLEGLYAEAALVVCPVFGGTGQQIKISEAMAHGVPVVALRQAAEASPLRHGINGWVADDAAGFAEGLVTLWRDRDLCRRLGEAGRETIAREYSRQRLLDGLAPLLESIADRPRQGGARGR